MKIYIHKASFETSHSFRNLLKKVAKCPFIAHLMCDSFVDVKLHSATQIVSQLSPICTEHHQLAINSHKHHKICHRLRLSLIVSSLSPPNKLSTNSMRDTSGNSGHILVFHQMGTLHGYKSVRYQIYGGGFCSFTHQSKA